MVIKFQDGNVIEVRGNGHFRLNVLEMLMPIIRAYIAVGELNSEPLDQRRLEVELQMVKEATESNQPFSGKYISIVDDDLPH